MRSNSEAIKKAYAVSLLESKPTIHVVQQTKSTTQDKPQIFPPEVYDMACAKLSIISDNNFFDDIWNVHLRAAQREGYIQFPNSTASGCLLRLLTLDYLSCGNTIGYAKQSVTNGNVFLTYLDDNHLNFDSVHSSTIDVFLEYLRTEGYTPVQINNILYTASRLYDIAYSCNLVFENQVVDFSHREKEPKASRRAPDQCVYEALDRFFFDRTQDIPTAFRCIYLLLRMIANRISEVLAMYTACIDFGLEYFNLHIPTSKETAAHIPKDRMISLSLTGKSEQLLLETIFLQQSAAGDSGYLFWDNQKRQMTTANSFNQYLKSVIKMQNIRDSKGKLADVTSHDFRHIAIGERLRAGVDPELVKLEAAHHSIAQTFAYGRGSENDEAERNKEISDRALAELVPVTDDAQHGPRIVNKFKFDALVNSPQNRIIPKYGVCSNQNCTPQFETCIDCQHFTVDPIYREYFDTALSILNQKISRLIHKGGSQEVLRRHTGQKEIFEKYLLAIDAQVDSQ